MTGIPDDLVEKAARVLDDHRWKSMGVSSVECECGEILYGDESLTQFPADERFRQHIASETIRAVGLPALLERLEAAEGNYAALMERTDFLKAQTVRQASDFAADKLRANEAERDRDALAAKVADAGERIALAIEAERDNTDRPDMFESGHWNGLNAAAQIARAALTERTTNGPE